MMSQRDVDAWDDFVEILKYGDRIAQHPRDTHDRIWWNDDKGGCWLHPGEFLVEYKGTRYIVSMRNV